LHRHAMNSHHNTQSVPVTMNQNERRLTTVEDAP
jgi:hypothetical protein